MKNDHGNVAGIAYEIGDFGWAISAQEGLASLVLDWDRLGCGARSRCQINKCIAARYARVLLCGGCQSHFFPEMGEVIEDCLVRVPSSVALDLFAGVQSNGKCCLCPRGICERIEWFRPLVGRRGDRSGVGRIDPAACFVLRYGGIGCAHDENLGGRDQPRVSLIPEFSKRKILFQEIAMVLL